MDYTRFVIQLGQSPMLTRWAVVISWFIPAIELIISILLTFRNTRLIGLHSALSLMAMFTTYIILATRFSDFVPCSCGGVIENLTWSQHLVFNLFFVGLGIIGVLIEAGLRKTITG